MIILPAIPAIVAALTPLAKAALVSAGIGAAVSGGMGAVGEGVASYQKHGEINREVLDDAARGAFEAGKDGAMVGFVIGPVAPLFAPVIAPAIHVVDDIVAPVIQIADDAAQPVIHVIDDAVGPTLRRAGRTVTVPARAISAKLNARNYRSLPDDLCSRGCLYIMDDPANGLTKIGVTTNPQQRIADVSRQVGSDLRYVSISPVDDAFVKEAALKRQFVSKNVPHPNYVKATEWYSGFNPMDVATVLSK